MNKVKLTKDQLLQMKNISNTLIEATEHFMKYVKEREFSQSLHIFSSIVEGYQAIQQLIFLAKENETDQHSILRKIEKHLVITADHLEHKRYIKITEIVQFSLLPSFKKLNNSFSGNTKENKIYTIGVYLNHANPIDVYPEARINALLKKAEEEQSNLIFFSSNDINFDNKTINAKLFSKDVWETKTVNFPDVIHNIGPVSKHQQSIAERKLRRFVPFTSFGVGNKFYLPKVMVKHRRFAELLVPFKVVRDEQMVIDYISMEENVVLKPILGARGESIYFVRKKGNRFIVSEHRQEKILNYDNFKKWITDILLLRKFSYLIQRYVECKTRDGEPFDIRSHMQKDKNGNWCITRIYPRIGSKHSILSNISKGGRTEHLNNFLINEYGEKKGSEYYKRLRTLSMELSEYLDRIHNFSLDEIGLDLAVDNTGRFWLHEANNGPQSTYHEEKRAVHTIGYALYVAKNGIVKQNHSHEIQGQFIAKSSSLPFAKVDQRHKIGMLKGQDEDEPLATACAYVAYFENVHFFTFSPKDIDYNAMLIKAQFFENGEWVHKIMEYPDIIYDRLRLKGIKGYNDTYEELNDIPFTNEFYGNSISKLEVYNKLKSTKMLDDVIIPYKKIDKNKDIFQYIERYGAVIIKPEIGSFARGVHYITRRGNNNYFMAEGNKENEYTEVTIRKYLNKLLDKGTFIAQQYINTRTIDGNPFDIRVHMMKDRSNNWSFARVYPRIGVHYATISSTNSGGYIGDLMGFLGRNFPNFNSYQLEEAIKTVSNTVVNSFERLFNEQFNEIALDLALDKNAKPYLIEINVNKPGIVNHFDIARLAIPNAIHLLRKKTNNFL